MKAHPGWLAAGVVLFAILACTVGNNNNNSNSNSNDNNNKSSSTSSSNTKRTSSGDVYVEKAYMAKDNNGEPGDEATSFEPGDHTIHCAVSLNKKKAGTDVKFIWLATSGKSEQIKTLDYTTQGNESMVHSHLTLPKDWPTGSYRVEIYINSALDKTLNFTVE